MVRTGDFLGHQFGVWAIMGIAVPHSTVSMITLQPGQSASNGETAIETPYIIDARSASPANAIDLV